MAEFVGSKVLFLQGTQSNLNNLISAGGAKEGAFYLTNDTHRLYIGRTVGGKVIPVAVNEGVSTVADVNSLPSTGVNAGEFYYASENNILCVYNGTKFVQINSDTNDNIDTYISAVDSEVVKADDNSKITLTLNMTQTTHDRIKNSTSTTPLTASFEIPKSYLDNLAGVAVDLTAASDTNGAVIKTSGAGSSGTGVKLVKGANVNMTTSGSDITISATDTKYTITSDATGAVTFTDSANNSKQAITFEAGNQAKVTVDTANKITVAHGDIAALTANTTENSTLTNHGEFTVLTAIETDNGHVTKYTPTKFTLPNIADGKVTAVNADNTGKINITVVDGANKSTTVSSAADAISFKVGKDGNTTVSNQGNLNVYTISEIDGMMQGLNALVYKGTVSLESNLPTSDVEAGYTYMADASFDMTIGDKTVNVKSGDLLIATGEETNGVLSNITWTYVPSGDDTDTQYELNVASNKITLKSTSGQIKEVGSATIAAGNDITVSTSGSTITVAHEEFGNATASDSTATDKTPGYGGKFTVVDGITNDNGHITGYTTKEITLPASDNTTYTYKTAAATNGASIVTTGVGGSDNNKATTIEFNKGTDINIVNDSDNLGMTISHATHNGTKTTEAVPVSERKFNVVNSLTLSNGHIDSYNLGEVTLPEERDFELSNAVASSITNGVTITTTLTETISNDATNKSTFSLVSESLKVTGSGSTITAELEWGSF